MPNIITEKELEGFIPDKFKEILNEVPKWDQEISFFFTHGKDTPKGWWPRSMIISPTTKGVVCSALVDSDKKRLVGAALIDISAHVNTLKNTKNSISVTPFYAPNRSPQIGSNFSLFNLRYLIMKTVSHEYVHFTQYWIVGDKAFAEEYNRIWKNLRDKAITEDPHYTDEEINDDIYKYHPLEQEAERVADVIVSKYGREIRSGEWDKMLPIDELSKYIQSK